MTASRWFSTSLCLILLSQASILVRQHILFVALTCMAVAFCTAEGPNDSLRKPPISYELYSWREPNGGWNFCLLPSPSGVNIPAEAVFDKRCLLRGVNGLSQKMSRLPAGVSIYWLDRILGNGPKAEKTESLGFPPADVIEQVRRYAERRHVEVQALRKNQKQ
jgi:hypothetical protein